MTLNKIPKRYQFLIAVIFLYLVMFWMNRALIIESLGKTLEVFIRIIPILVLVFFIMFLINRYLTSSRIKKHLGNESGLKGWVYATVGGILISGPPYVLYPLLGQLKQDGMAYSLIAVFLYNRNVKIPFVPVMIYYFGLSFTVVVSLFIIIFSLINGLAMGYLTENEPLPEK